ncbi:hypothetical protein PSY23_23415, partial [Shigella flexneri]|nr:hypothetical protein [Shigella flexneri]
IERRRVKEWKKNRAYNMLSTRDSSQSKDTYKLKVKELEKIFNVNGNDRKGILAIVVSDKIDY